MTDHLKNRHNIGSQGRIETRGPLLEGFRRQASRSTADSENYHRVATSFNRREFKERLIRCFIRNDLPFVLLRDESFRELLGYTNNFSPANTFLPVDTTLRTWIINKFEESKALVISKLSRCQGQVHISFDMWTSRNQLLRLWHHRPLR